MELRFWFWNDRREFLLILILYVTSLIYVKVGWDLDIAGLKRKKLAFFYLVIYVLSVEQKTYLGKVQVFVPF